MAKRGLFVAGTDTGVGKTWVAAGLVGALRRRGLDVGAWKPLQSGTLPGDPAADSYVLKTVGDLPDPEERIASFRYEAPLTPLLAARLAGRPVFLADVLAQAPAALGAHAACVVEAAGGLLAPAGEDFLGIDLARALGLPVLLVARPGLGTVNHCLLSLEALRRRGLAVAGVVLNGYRGPLPPDIADFAELRDPVQAADSLYSNPLLVRQYGQVEILGKLPWLEGDSGAIVAACERHLRLDLLAPYFAG